MKKDSCERGATENTCPASKGLKIFSKNLITIPAGTRIQVFVNSDPDDLRSDGEIEDVTILEEMDVVVVSPQCQARDGWI